MRKDGLACDNLLSVDVVTADGRLLAASVTDNADLFGGCGEVVATLVSRLRSNTSSTRSGPCWEVSSFIR